MHLAGTQLSCLQYLIIIIAVLYSVAEHILPSWLHGSCIASRTLRPGVVLYANCSWSRSCQICALRASALRWYSSLVAAGRPRQLDANLTKTCCMSEAPLSLASAMPSFMYSWYAESVVVAFTRFLTASFSCFRFSNSSLYGFCSSGEAAFHQPMMMAMRSRPDKSG
ncbi:hypothetical protein V8C86DRAFT_1621442 [Haematococcus lacustris]